MTPPRFEPIIIAIDGPAAAGKGTLARRLAQHFNLPYLDTGLLYRAVARRVIEGPKAPFNMPVTGIKEIPFHGLWKQAVQARVLYASLRDAFRW